MDRYRFTQPTGNLVPITTPEPDLAFIPHPLPPSWEWESSLWPLLSQANGALRELNGVASTLPHPELFLLPLQRVESLKSSRLEGTFATAQELMLFELEGKEPQKASDPSSAWQEVNNYTNALRLGYIELANLPFCLRLIKDLHKTLMYGVRGSSKNPGELRRVQVHIGHNRRYVPPPPVEAETCFHDLEDYINKEDPRYDPLVRCFIVHYQLEAIHPFLDGNGRIGRVVLALMIYKWCNLTMPWLYMSQYFERYKDEYMDLMFKVSAIGDWKSWLEFCIRGVLIQANRAISVCKRLKDIRAEMHKSIKEDCSSRTHPIIEGLFNNAFVRVTDIVKTYGVTYTTAKRELEYLVSKGILTVFPEVKVRTYFCAPILGIAYQDPAES